jgi:D-tyrosyl-tRNA(Tyr) deacylase
MRAVIQRVKRAEVTVGAEFKRSIGPGLLVLLGVEPADGMEDVEWLADKIVRVRIFDDAKGVMNRSVADISGEIMLISQFTLFASTRKGTRPSWHRAARPEAAVPLYELFHRKLEELLAKTVPTGVFGAHMVIDLANDGPVTLQIDSKLRE